VYGNVLGASALERMISCGEMILDPFEERFLGLAHYRLHAGAIYREDLAGGDDKLAIVQRIDGESPALILQPNQYLLLEIRENVVLPEGIYGRLTAASTLIERGFLVNSGKVDAGYGAMSQDRQPILVGIKNLTDRRNHLDLASGIAHIEFVDLRGTESRFGGFSNESLSSFAQRTERVVRAGTDSCEPQSD